MAAAYLIDRAFEDLTQSFRVLLEAHHRANRGGLLYVDRAEAVGNIETALSSVLNAFHSLYDAVEKQLGKQPVDWYRTGELAIILAIRNARHHNKANKIRTLYTFHVHEAARLDRMEQYVLIDFRSLKDRNETFDVYLSWADLHYLLSLEKQESHLSKSTVMSIRDYLGCNKFDEYAEFFSLGRSRVFFNIVPLFVNASITIVPLIKEHIRGSSTESRFFAEHFQFVEPADTKNPEVNCGPFVLPK